MEIGIYGNKSDSSEKCIVNAIYRSTLTPKWNSILALKYDPFIARSVFMNKYQNSKEQSNNFDYYDMHHDKGYCYTLLEYLCHNHRNIRTYNEMESVFIENSDLIFHSTTLFDEELFLEQYEIIKIVSKEKSISIGEKYIDDNGEKVFVLGIARTDIDEDFHTVIIRHKIDGDFNKYTDYDHHQFGITPDYYNCSFISRRSFLKKFKKINS